jgi:arsenate reductase
MTSRRVLFLCTHNSARSQMAEGFLRALGGDRFEVASAGTEARGLNPLAVQAMAEVGIDISLQESKTLERYQNEAFDLVITVCDAANESCPYFANAKERRHWSFPDPSAVGGDDETQFAAFRDVRDAVHERIERELLEVRTG